MTAKTPTVTNPITGVEVELPWKWEICDYCHGRGTTTLHGIAITESEWSEWDVEEREAYFSGAYDGPCESPNGCEHGKMKVIDTDRCDPELIAAYEADRQALAEILAEEAAERRMGA